jgi:S-adenosylmethionine synthetase
LQDTYPDFAAGYNILIEINSQSPEIAAQVVEQKTIRAGDQGMTINGATADSPTLEPITVYLSNEFSIRIEKEVRKNNHKDIKSDFKVQFSMNYESNEIIANLSIAHSPT